jgi:hypothetical protein
LSTDVEQIKSNLEKVWAELTELPDMENRMSKNSEVNCEILAEELNPKFPLLEKSLGKRIDLRVQLITRTIAELGKEFDEKMLRQKNSMKSEFNETI